jgi:hypothetical protein
MCLFTTRKFGWIVNSRRSCSNNDYDHVSLIGGQLALLPSRLKSQGGVLTKPEQLIDLIFANQQLALMFSTSHHQHNVKKNIPVVKT